MRQLTTLPDEATASRLADYLLTLEIETRLEREPDGWALWVCDEDRVEQARAELEQFTRNPADPRYESAGRSAEEIRRHQTQQDEAYRRRQARARRALQNLEGPQPVTMTLLLLCVACTLFTGFGQSAFAARWLYISSHPHHGLEGILHGEVWRLITPIFLHLNPLHLLFNASMLYSLGGAVERRRGWVRYLLLVLLLAVASNLGQYYFGGSGFVKEGPREGEFVLARSVWFGGMSGVLYGLFGYVWMKARFQPEAGLYISAQSVLILMGWFVLCWLGVLGRIANMAHTVGLLLGMAVAYAPLLLQRRE